MTSPETQQNDEKVHVFWHEGMLEHDTGRGVFHSGTDPGFLDVQDKHQENPDRVRNMASILERGSISPFISWHQGRPAAIEELTRFHTQDYIEELINTDKTGCKELGSGTFLTPGSWHAALLATSTAISDATHT